MRLNRGAGRVVGGNKGEGDTARNKYYKQTIRQTQTEGTNHEQYTIAAIHTGHGKNNNKY